MSEFNRPANPTAGVTIDISYAELSGANPGQRPDLLARAQAVYRTPDGKLYNAQDSQLKPANNLVSKQSKGIDVAGNKTLAASDLEQVQDVSAAATLTIPTDAVLGIAADDRVSVAAYQMTAGAVAWAGSGATLRGTAPTAAQYLVTGLVHVGSNEWAYL